MHLLLARAAASRRVGSMRMSHGRARFALLIAASFIVSDGHGEDAAAEREAMVRTIERMARTTASETGRRTLDPGVLEAMRTVPRHRFVPASLRGSAYANRPLPIGHGQTISQPYIVALMTDLLELEPGDRVLEIGTGSAYQAAVLAELVQDVRSVEIIEPLARAARERLVELGYANVEVRHGDGYFGWAQGAPFDAIVVTAAAGHVPPPLVAQLAPGGVLVVPVGGAFAVQHLLVVRKDAAGDVRVRSVLPVRFVPLTGGH